ncbi:unnamed protein product, partial [Symbiodinium sp. CCMP2456]
LRSPRERPHGGHGCCRLGRGRAPLPGLGGPVCRSVSAVASDHRPAKIHAGRAE